MTTCQELISQLLSAQRFIRSRDVQVLSRTSRQTVWRQLRRLEEAGVLVREGVGRGARYRQAASVSGNFEPDELSSVLWRELTSRCPAVRVIALRKLSGMTCRTRRQALAILAHVPPDGIVIIDCAGVGEMAEPFVWTLFAEREAYPTVGPINVEPRVADVIARVRARYRRMPHSDYGT